ncbi:MAG: hypothetical protein NTY04_03800 [Candidatus Staskawiczbacteria bacterium]|nr:hypothetical protein [Candidatus Staskawiczbacteria bacterium]
MELVNYLAEIWGISIAIVSLALLIKEKHLKKLFAAVEAEDDLFMWGLASLVIGLGMILSYNVWAQSWQVIITILGWVSLIKGLCLLFTPELAKKWTKKLETSSFLPYVLFAGVLIGLVITYFAFTA